MNHQRRLSMHALDRVNDRLLPCGRSLALRLLDGLWRDGRPATPEDFHFFNTTRQQDREYRIARHRRCGQLLIVRDAVTTKYITLWTEQDIFHA